MNTILMLRLAFLPLLLTNPLFALKVYVASKQNNSVNIFDTSSNIITKNVTDTMSTFSQPAAIAITPDATIALVVNEGGAGSVSIINIASDTVIGNIVDPSFNVPLAIAITTDGTKAYVVNEGNSVSVIDIATETVIKTITDSSFDLPTAIAVTNTAAYVVNSANNSVSIINIASDTVINTVGTPNFSVPVNIAINQINQRPM